MPLVECSPKHICRVWCNLHLRRRIVGVAGDSVLVDAHDEAGLPVATTSLIPRGHVWLEGDNPHSSTDSRCYGPVPEALLLGRVVCRLWPLCEAKIISREPERGRRRLLPPAGDAADPNAESRVGGPARHGHWGWFSAAR